jgi:hypothetical protein
MNGALLNLCTSMKLPILFLTASFLHVEEKPNILAELTSALNHHIQRGEATPWQPPAP